MNTQHVYAQVEVAGTINGTIPIPYLTLKAAFDAINTGTHTGVITVNITGNTTEAPVAAAPSVVLNASGTGGASYTAINMQSTGGSWTISGAATVGQPLLDINGADNLTINGLIGVTKSLTFSNTTVSATLGTSTIRFQADATTNVITNCIILGSATMGPGVEGGNIWFGAAALSTGNDNNTISNCDLGPAGTNLPSKCIYFNGSSNTNPGTANSGIVITNNNIFDYFSATISTEGIDLISGTVGTTISNNRFYQTAMRTMTTSSLTHSGIRISNSSGNAYQITGNTIGFAAANGTGMYTILATGISMIVPINLSVGTTTATSVQGNTVAGIAISGASSGTSSSGPFRGIYIGAGLVTVGDVTGNTIGSQSVTGSITYTSSATGASDIIGIHNFGSSNWVSSNNTIGGISVANSNTGASNIYGIRCNTGATVTWACQNNIIGGTVANSIQSTNTSTVNTIQGIRNENPISTISGNIIRNMTAAGGTATTTGASMIGINNSATTVTMTISQNTIFNLSNTHATAATTVTGIQFTGGTAGNIVERNNIYGLTSSSNSTAADVTGIRVSGGTTTYRNNMIAIGAGIMNALGTSATGINGIVETSGIDNFFHNSIFIDGAPTAGVGTSFAFNSSVTSSTRSFRDNIFYNARSNSGATGKNYAVRVGGTSPNPTGLTINNNVYYLTGTGAVFGFYNSLDVPNLAAWKTAVGQDAASFEGLNPQFLDPTNAIPDLHINPSVISVIESNGADVGVTIDYDGQTRAGLTPVDIGADAGLFMGGDFVVPIIVYAPLGNGCTPSANQTLTATITDVGSGVPTAGIGLPVLYYKVNAGPYTGVTGVFVSGNTYTFTFGAAATMAGDIVSYYIVAQDGAPTPNVIANPSAGAGGYLANPPSATTPPTTPNTFTVTGTISGTYTIGVGGNYTTLTAAVADYNNKCLGSAIVFNLIDATYTGETFPITINANVNASVVNTLTIKTTVASTTITGSAATALIILNGADYVTIDGSVSSTANTVCPLSAASKDLTITNSNTGTSSAVIWIQTAGANGATNNTIKNCNLTGNSNTTTLFGIGSGSSTISITSLGTGNNNNSIINNNISKTQRGIYAQGASVANKNTGTIINQNLINSAAPNNVQIGGIFIGFDNGAVISGNKIANINPSAVGAFAIALGIVPANTYTSFTGNEVTGVTVSKNAIDNILRSGDGSSYGIVVSAVTSVGALANSISNNMISGVNTTAATPSDSPYGIEIGGGATSSTFIYYNTISMTGVGSNSANCFGIAIGGSNPTVDIRNNIIVNKQTSTTGKMYALAFAYSTFTNLTSDNNDFFVTADANHFDIGTGSFATPAGATRASWNTSTGKDGASVNTDPVFMTASNLHIDAGNPSNLPLDNGAVSIGSVTDDIDCEIRMTDIGADEFAIAPCTGATGGTAAVTGPSSFCASGTPVITASGYSTGSNSGYQWITSTNSGDWPGGGTAVSGQTNPASLSTGPVTVTRHYWLRVTCNVGVMTDNSNFVTITINPSAAIVSGPSVKCSADPAITLNETGGTGTSWIWSTAETTQSISVNPGSTTTYSVTVTSPGGCTAVTSKSVTVNPNPTGVTAMASANPVCEGAPFDLSSTFNPYTAVILSEGFESGAAGWTFEDSSSTGINFPQQLFHIQPSPYTDPLGSTTFLNFSVSGSNFGYTNSDAGGTGSQTRTNLVSPTFSTVGFSGIATLTFKNGYKYWASSLPPERVEVQITTNGGASWTNLAFYHGADVGITTSNAQTTVTSTVNVPAIYMGLPNVKIRFRYRSNFGYYWVLDDILLTANGAPAFTWSSSPAGFISSVQNPTGLTESFSHNYTVTVTGAAGCQTQASTGIVVVTPSIVMNTSDSGPGSLRDLVACVGPGATISFDPSLVNQTITLTSGSILINKNITFSGPTGMGVINISGNSASAVFNVVSGNMQLIGNINVRL
ncbi:MAG TPA: hypothetical protein VFG10_05920 [Saprospiraceae bacterium]|nr:hypothetical protein [Saprospiraceae bacterium]